jgi:hypothetical protein
MRSKSRTLSKVPEKPEDLPHWNYDGSSTGQAPGTDSEVYLIPRAIFRCAGAPAAALSLSCCCYCRAAAAGATGHAQAFADLFNSQQQQQQCTLMEEEWQLAQQQHCSNELLLHCHAYVHLAAYASQTTRKHHDSCCCCCHCTAHHCLLLSITPAPVWLFSLSSLL